MSKTVTKGKIDTIKKINVSWQLGQVTPQEIWETKDAWHAKTKSSKEEWDLMNTEQQEAVTRIVKAAIERLHDTIDEWIPEAIEVKSGEFLDVYFRVLFTDIDKEIHRNDQATSFKVKEAAKGTKAIIDALGGVQDGA